MWAQSSKSWSSSFDCSRFRGWSNECYTRNFRLLNAGRKVCLYSPYVQLSQSEFFLFLFNVIKPEIEVHRFWKVQGEKFMKNQKSLEKSNNFHLQLYSQQGELTFPTKFKGDNYFESNWKFENVREFCSTLKSLGFSYKTLKSFRFFRQNAWLFSVSRVFAIKFIVWSSYIKIRLQRKRWKIQGI